MTDEAEALNQRLHERRKVLSNSTSSKRSLVNTQSVSPHTQRRAVNEPTNPIKKEGDQGLKLPNYYSVYNQSQTFAAWKKNEPKTSKFLSKPRRSIHIENSKQPDNLSG